MKAAMKPDSDLPVAWCATCGFEDPHVDRWLVGARFRCEKQSDTEFHVAAIVPPSMKYWLRLLSWLVSWTDASWHPRVCRWLGKSSAERYGVIVAALTLTSVMLATAAWPVRWVGVAFALWVILDLLVYNLRVAFVTQHPQVPLRSAAFGILGFILIALSFAALYVSLVPNDFEPGALTRISAIYFSFVTMATVGFGDIHPKLVASCAQAIVVTEVVVGLVYVAVVLVTLVAWANTPARLLTLDQLRRQNST